MSLTRGFQQQTSEKKFQRQTIMEANQSSQPSINWGTLNREVANPSPPTYLTHSEIGLRIKDTENQ